jgi:hypothetical protein
MTLTIPNIQSITSGSTGYDFQAVSDATDWNAEQLAMACAAYVISGLEVTVDTGMTVTVASGSYVINSVEYSYAGGTVTVTAASSTDRRDIITINSSGTLTVTAGTPCGTAGWTRVSPNLPPVKPAIPSNQVILAEIAVPSGTASIASINIVDKTCLTSPENNVGNYTTTTQSTTTTSALAATNLSFNIAANEVVRFEALLSVQCSSTTTAGGSKFAVTAPTGATGILLFQGPVTSNTTLGSWSATTTFGSLTGPFAETTGRTAVKVEGTVVNSNTAGTVGIQFAANATTFTVSIEPGSSIVAFAI